MYFKVIMFDYFNFLLPFLIKPCISTLDLFSEVQFLKQILMIAGCAFLRMI